MTYQRKFILAYDSRGRVHTDNTQQKFMNMSEQSRHVTNFITWNLVLPALSQIKVKVNLWNLPQILVVKNKPLLHYDDVGVTRLCK